MMGVSGAVGSPGRMCETRVWPLPFCFSNAFVGLSYELYTPCVLFFLYLMWVGHCLFDVFLYTCAYLP